MLRSSFGPLPGEARRQLNMDSTETQIIARQRRQDR
jgi:hypothetical protein